MLKLITLFLVLFCVFNVSANNFPRDSKFYSCISSKEYSEILLKERGCQVFVSDEVTKPAKRLLGKRPKYPEFAAKNNITGHLKVELIINEIGGVVNVKVTESVPLGVFDEEGIKAFKTWIYRPAKLKELKVMQKVFVQYDFKI